MTFMMHAVATGHKNNRRSRCEHIFTANRAIAFKVSLNALVPPFQTNCHANVAGLAVEVVYPQSFPDSAYTTVMAVINIFLGIAVPELALFAIVF